MDSNTASCKIDVKSDGVYLIIDTPPGTQKITQKEVLRLIESHGVEGVNPVTLMDIFKSNAEHIETKISSNTNMSRNAEQITVTISTDYMEAIAKFEAPQNNGARLTTAQIKEAVVKAGVKFGILDDAIFDVSLSHLYGKNYVLARGLMPSHGDDGKLIYHINTNKRAPKPKEREDGSVDFHELNLIDLVEKGQLLATKVEPQPGTSGINVFGDTVAPVFGKPAPPLPVGKYLVESPDGTQVVAGVSGQIIVEGSKITISPILELKGDVDNATGNVEFNGSVIVRGVIRSGFSVKAVGNIECYGVVEGAIISSEGDVFLYNGLQGGGKAEISAVGDIVLKFATRCKLKAGRNITADCIMHSEVVCDGSIELQGKNRLIIGGKVKAGRKLIARVIGSYMSTTTEVEIGMESSATGEYRELVNEFGAVRKEYVNTDKLVATMSDPKILPTLNEAKKNLLLKNILAKKVLRAKMDELQKKIDQIAPEIEKSGSGSIVIQEVIYPGVKVMIGNAVMHINDSISNCTLKNSEGRIIVDR